jgi:hypothetical protein
MAVQVGWSVVRVWRSWLRHWLRYAEVVGAQWR